MREKRKMERGRNSKDLITVRRIRFDTFPIFRHRRLANSGGDWQSILAFPRFSSRNFPPGGGKGSAMFPTPACDLSRWESAHWQVGHFSSPRGKTDSLPPPPLPSFVDFCSVKYLRLRRESWGREKGEGEGRSECQVIGCKTGAGEMEKGVCATTDKFSEIYSTLTHYIFHGGVRE